MSRNRRFIVAALLLATPSFAFAQNANPKVALADALNGAYNFTSPYTLHVDGLHMNSAFESTEPTFTVDPKLGVQNHQSQFRFLALPPSQRSIQAGDQFFLVGVDVDAHYLRFHLRSALAYNAINADGTSSLSFYRFAIKFPLQRGAIATLTPADVHRLADPIFSPTPPPVIHIGQTQEEVHNALGDPTQEIALDNKYIAVFGKVKVVFVDGRVTDVQ